MANQKAIMFGRGVSGKIYKVPLTVVDTDATAATWTTYGAASSVQFPEAITWDDLQSVAAVATITRLDFTINGTTFANGAILAASIANQTTDKLTRFGSPVQTPPAALIQLIAHT